MYSPYFQKPNWVSGNEVFKITHCGKVKAITRSFFIDFDEKTITIAAGFASAFGTPTLTLQYDEDISIERMGG